MQKLLSTIAILCCGYAATAYAQAVSLNIYHRGLVPKDIAQFRIPHIRVQLKDLRDLERLEQEVSDAVIGSSTIDPKRIDILQRRIARLDAELIRKLKEAALDHHKAYTFGIDDDHCLPAMVFEWERKRWVHCGNSLKEAHTLWLERK